jgi:hypothetical protein
MPGLGALLVGIYSNVMVVRWAEGDWVHAVRQSRQAHAGTGALAAAPMEPFASRGTSPKSSVTYTVPWFDDIPTLASKTRAEAEHLSGQDGAVLRAWAGHLEKLYASYTNTWAVSNELYSLDLLDPKLVTYFTDAEAVRRRGVANRFSSAWHEMDGALSKFANSFYEDLRLQGVTPERTQVETQALAAFMGRPEVASRIDALRVFCSVEHDVGSYYNYAASAVFDYARMLKQTPAAATVSRPRMDEQVGKVRELEQSAARARQEATAKLTG